jgi:DNA-binding transcriptional MerR regulator
MQNTLSLKDVARLLNVKPYRVEYLLSNQIVPEPKLRISGRRVFGIEDVRRLAEHFKVKLPETEPVAETVGT